MTLLGMPIISRRDLTFGVEEIDQEARNTAQLELTKSGSQACKVCLGSKARVSGQKKSRPEPNDEQSLEVGNSVVVRIQGCFTLSSGKGLRTPIYIR